MFFTQPTFSTAVGGSADNQLPNGPVFLAAHPPQTALRRDFKSQTYSCPPLD